MCMFIHKNNLIFCLILNEPITNSTSHEIKSCNTTPVNTKIPKPPKFPKILSTPCISNNNLATIKYKYQLRHLELFIDKVEKDKINIFYEKDKNYIDIVLGFTNEKKALEIKKFSVFQATILLSSIKFLISRAFFSFVKPNTMSI